MRHVGRYYYFYFTGTNNLGYWLRMKSTGEDDDKIPFEFNRIKILSNVWTICNLSDPILTHPVCDPGLQCSSASFTVMRSFFSRQRKLPLQCMWFNVLLILVRSVLWNAYCSQHGFKHCDPKLLWKVPYMNGRQMNTSILATRLAFCSFSLAFITANTQHFKIFGGFNGCVIVEGWVVNNKQQTLFLELLKYQQWRCWW